VSKRCLARPQFFSLVIMTLIIFWDFMIGCVVYILFEKWVSDQLSIFPYHFLCLWKIKIWDVRIVIKCHVWYYRCMAPSLLKNSNDILKFVRHV
jgi:hypothetical protein